MVLFFPAVSDLIGINQYFFQYHPHYNITGANLQVTGAFLQKFLSPYSDKSAEGTAGQFFSAAE